MSITTVSRYYDITGMGNIYRNIRTIVITVKLSLEKQRRWWVIIQLHVQLLRKFVGIMKYYLNNAIMSLALVNTEYV